MKAVRFGRLATGGKVHMAVGTVIACPYAARKPFLIRLGADGKPNPLKAGEFEATDVCFFCRRIENLAAASERNVYGPSWSGALEKLLRNVTPVYSAKYLRMVAAEIAPSTPVDMSHGFSGAMRTERITVVTPVVEIEPAPVKPRNAFADAVARMGVRSKRPVVNRRPATRRNANVHARFAA